MRLKTPANWQRSFIIFTLLKLVLLHFSCFARNKGRTKCWKGVDTALCEFVPRSCQLTASSVVFSPRALFVLNLSLELNNPVGHRGRAELIPLKFKIKHLYPMGPNLCRSLSWKLNIVWLEQLPKTFLFVFYGGVRAGLKSSFAELSLSSVSLELTKYQ